MILKNKLTRETLEITYPEFRKKFAKEIQDVFESYRKTNLNKYSYNFKDDNSIEFNFYFELHWNFNHFGNSNLYIKECKICTLIKRFLKFYPKLLICISSSFCVFAFFSII